MACKLQIVNTRIFCVYYIVILMYDLHSVSTAALKSFIALSFLLVYCLVKNLSEIDSAKYYIHVVFV